MKSHSLRRALTMLALPLAAAGAPGCSSDSTPDGASGMSGTSGMSGASGASGMSGASGTAGNPPENCMTDFGPTDPSAFIDDLEDGNSGIAPVVDRNGGWWISSDGTLGGTVEPPAEQAPTPERILGGRCESEYAMRMTGQGFTQWGAVLLAAFRFTGQAEPIDASRFRGVRFWARVGETHNSPIRVQFQDSNTAPEGGNCDPTPGSAEECYNGFGSALFPLSREWRLYQLDFSSLRQQDYGHRADSLDTANIYNVGWGVQQNSVFDVWVDDLWFYE